MTSIGEVAFYNCSSLREITIPASVTYIGSAAFQFCSSLSEIRVASDNPEFCSIDGVLFSKSGKELCAYPGGRAGTYTIPAGVTSIWDRAFVMCGSLSNISIPDSVTSIGYSAFAGCSSLSRITIPASVTVIEIGTFASCSSLREITIPDSVTSIEFFTFDECSSLTDVYYGGSQQQWKAIEIGGMNEPLTSATIHYNAA